MHKKEHQGAKISAGILKGLVFASAALTFLVLFFLIVYILVHGIPNLTPQLFAWKYTSENASMLPSIINTLIIVILSLVIAVPLGIFSAIYLVEYAKRGNKFVKIIRLTTETLSGIPSIVYGLFGALFFVTALKGLFFTCRCSDIVNYDSSADYENDGRSIKIRSGFPFVKAVSDLEQENSERYFKLYFQVQFPVF